MRMFKLFDITSEGYIPNNMFRPHRHDEQVNATHSLSSSWPLTNAKNEILGIQWNYGNEVGIPFEVKGHILNDSEGTIEDVWDFLLGANIYVEFLDHFYEVEYSYYTVIEDIAPTGFTAIYELPVDEVMSKLLKPGTHHIRITLSDYNIELYNPQDSIICIH